jgi:hypothetical protein
MMMMIISPFGQLELWAGPVLGCETYSHQPRMFSQHSPVIEGVDAVVLDDDDDDKPVWPTWAVGAPLQGRETYSHQSVMLEQITSLSEVEGKMFMAMKDGPMRDFPMPPPDEGKIFMQLKGFLKAAIPRCTA